MKVLQRISKMKVDLAEFIKSWVKKNNGFKCRSFYGETFALAFLYRENMLDEFSKRCLYNSFDALDKEDSQFHWEFNNYALISYLNESCDDSIRKHLEPLRFKHTPCTNWTLLRSNVRICAGFENEIALKEAKRKIEKFQLDSGLILDDPGVKSFQYHCFSMAMIAEIFCLTKDSFFLNSFLRGVSFIRNFILHNGEALYIGRGQNQSFGYGVLIYILALAYSFSNEKSLLGDIDRVIKFLEKFQRKDGSFPLVLNGVENSIPVKPDLLNEEFVGWYPYNNYFDYLPFFGLFLSKAYEVLIKLDCSGTITSKASSYFDSNFLKIVKPRYEAVLAKPGGYWTNDLPIPYIVAKGVSLTPCYGGEQYQTSLYNVKGLPLPFCLDFQKSIRWCSKSFFRGTSLWMVSPLGIMKREFFFEEDRIKIKTRIFSPFKFEHIYLILWKQEKYSKDVLNYKFMGYEYSASGRLVRLVDSKRVSIFSMNL